MIHPARVQDLNDKPIVKGAYVLYWMQQSQRAEYNHALEYAVRPANAPASRSSSVFGLTGTSPKPTSGTTPSCWKAWLRWGGAGASGASGSFSAGDADAVAVELAGRRCLVVTDRGYLRVQKAGGPHARRRRVVRWSRWKAM